MLKDIKLPNGLTYIGQNAFYKCAFDSIVFPASLEYLGGGSSAYWKYITIFPFTFPSVREKSIDMLLVGTTSRTSLKQISSQPESFRLRWAKTNNVRYMEETESFS